LGEGLSLGGGDLRKGAAALRERLGLGPAAARGALGLPFAARLAGLGLGLRRPLAARLARLGLRRPFAARLAGLLGLGGGLLSGAARDDPADQGLRGARAEGEGRGVVAVGDRVQG